MLKVSLAALSLTCATALAQSASAPDGGTPPSTPPASKPPGQSADSEEARRELDAKLEAIKRDMREEIRAQMATQSLAQGWQEELTEEKRKLELFVPNGYLRIRPELFNKFDLNFGRDPSGFAIFPPFQRQGSPVSAGERTIFGTNMRFRFEPTLNVSEEVRIKMQVDALDNMVFGSTPDYAWSRSEYANFTAFSNSQSSPTAGFNSLRNSIAVKRVYGEVSTPIWGGILRFGRMGSHWGLGMLHNDGNCLDCDRGDTVDRIMFVAEPANGFFVTPMVDWNAVGPTSDRTGEGGQPFPLSNQDAVISLSLALARRDVESQAKQKLQSGQAVFNYGLYFTYRSQKYDAANFYQLLPFRGQGGDPNVDLSNVYVPRNASLYTPDVWVKYERKRFRLELEAAAVLGNIGNSALRAEDRDATNLNQSLSIVQFGAVGQSEFRFVDGALKVGLEVGFASGDRAPGFGNRPRRLGMGPGKGPLPGDIDGPQYCLNIDLCNDSSIKNFQFNKDYRIDLILWRELLGGITDAFYFKPSINYEVADGFNLFGAIIYSRSIFAESTPSTTSNALGLELNVGARYETEDGFFAQLAYGILFPLAGLQNFSNNNPGLSTPGLDNAQALRGMLGIKF